MRVSITSLACVLYWLTSMAWSSGNDYKIFNSLTEKARAENSGNATIPYRALVPTLHLPSELETILRKALRGPLSLITQASYHSSPTHDYLAMKLEVGSGGEGGQRHDIRHTRVVIRKLYGVSYERAEIFVYDRALALLYEGSDQEIEARFGPRLYPAEIE